MSPEPGFTITLSGIQAMMGILASTGALITTVIFGVKAVCKANAKSVENIGRKLLDEHVRIQHKEPVI